MRGKLQPGPVPGQAHLHPHGPVEPLQEGEAEAHCLAKLRRLAPEVRHPSIRTVRASREHVCGNLQAVQTHEAVRQVNNFV